MDKVENAAVTQPASFGWRTLLLLATAANLAILLFMALFQRENLALVLSVVILTGLGLLWLRSGVLGMLLLGLVYADIAVWTVSGAINNFLNAEAWIDLILPSCLGIFSLVGVVSAMGAWSARRNPEHGQRAARLVGLAAVALLSASLAASVLIKHNDVSAKPAELVLETANMKFSQTALEVQKGEVTLRLTNHDLWWHTFTIKELGVDLRVPMGAEREITFQAPAGTYQYICGIPGHAGIGMSGTLTIR